MKQLDKFTPVIFDTTNSLKHSCPRCKTTIINNKKPKECYDSMCPVTYIDDIREKMDEYKD